MKKFLIIQKDDVILKKKLEERNNVRISHREL
jgi:hypothetical protein